MTTDERIIALVKPEYMGMVPSFVRQHATERVCSLIERDYPDEYKEFSAEEAPNPEVMRRMKTIVNDVFMERMDKHRKLEKL